MKLNIEGFLSVHENGECDDVLFVHTIAEPIAEYLESKISNKKVTVRYWISKEKLSREDVEIEFLKELDGVANCDWGHRYSDYTGYLWTDEKCKIGGHDLIEELKSHSGKYLNLEIEIHRKLVPPQPKRRRR